VVHRRAGFRPEPPYAMTRAGLPVTRLEQSIVDSWPVLPPNDRRAPVIRAVAERMTTPARLGAALAAAPHLTDRPTLRRVVDLLAAGCHSPLEMWGYDRVFVGPGMPEFRRQARVQVNGHAVYLDLLAEDEMVNFELDGDAAHRSAADRERDLRRDAALAAMGILVVRFSRWRLTHEPDAVRREVLAILKRRRAERRYAAEPAMTLRWTPAAEPFDLSIMTNASTRATAP
jgi:very-short-patch-repair endonuclease